MRNLKSCLMASVALGCFAAQPAHAFNLDVMGGGATFPSVVYRQILDCLWTPIGDGTSGPSTLPLNTNCPTYPFGSVLGESYMRWYYSPTGSGNGKLVLKTNNNQNLTVPSTSNIVPYTSSIYPTYPWPQAAGYQFTGSDDSWNTQDVTDWNTACGATCRGGAGPSPQAQFGNVIALPSIAGPVTIPFTGTDAGGHTLNTTAGNGNINLSRTSLCGIFSGHITKWSNTQLATDNGVASVGTGQITVVHRSDGSGTNFLFTSALSEQCRFVYGPNNETDTTIVSYAFPWTDHLNPATLAQCATNLEESRGSNTVNWPDQFNPDQCNKANPMPSGSLFVKASNNAGVVSAVQTTPGAIGYSTADLVLPIASSGPPAANIQSQYDLNVNNGQYEAPTTTGTSLAIGSAVPSFPTPADRANPLAWAGQAGVPNPGTPGAYPIAGFTWIDVYQCYATSAGDGVNMPFFLNQFYAGLYGSDSIGAIINSNGFIRPPYPWLVEIYNLLNDPTYQPNLSGTGDCTGINGAR